MKEKINLANALTASRILFAVLILFNSAFSAEFYICYLLGAFTDMIDGTIARRMNTQSTFGSVLDSVADCVFVAATGITVLSAVYIPEWLWIWIGIIVFIKAVNLITSLIKYRRLVPIHTGLNKVTGGLLFLLPLGIGRGAWQASAIAIIVTGVVATAAAVQEGHYIRTGRETL